MVAEPYAYEPRAQRPHVTGVDPGRLDPAGQYALAPDLAVVSRGPGAVQLGTEPSRRVLVTGLPAGAIAVLRRLRAPVTLGEASHLFGGAPGWHTLLTRLIAAGFLVPVGGGAGARGTDPASLFTPERLTLIHQHGPEHAGRLLAQRADAVVVIEGWDAVAAALGDLLGTSGIGRVYRPARVGVHPRSASGPVANPRAGDTVTSGSSVDDPRPPAVVPQRAPSTVRHHHPPSHTPPDLVVLAGARQADRGRAAALVAAMVPHLAVRAGTPRGIVGPLVLPGRSACLNCLDRHRTDRDPDWRAIAATAPYAPPTSLMTQSVAALAARQVLDWIDGMHRPASVDATLECDADRLGPARRSWPQHPGCGCRLLG